MRLEGLRYTEKIMTNRKGFTLVEMLMTMAIVSLIGTALYSIFGQERMRSIHESEIIEMQMNARSAIDRLSFVFSNAGFGAQSSFSGGDFMTGDEPQGEMGVSIDSVFKDFIDEDASGGGSDSVVVTFGWRAIGDVNSTLVSEDSDAVPVNRNRDINGKEYTEMTIDGSGGAFKNYFCFFPSTRSDNFYELTGVASASGTKQYIFTFDVEDMNFLRTQRELISKIYLVSPIKVMVADDPDTGIPYLYLKNYSYNDKGIWQVARNVQNLQLRIGSDEDVVEIFLLMRSEKEDPKYIDTKTYDMGDGTVGPFNDHYHRILSRAVVKVRGGAQ